MTNFRRIRLGKIKDIKALLIPLLLLFTLSGVYSQEEQFQITNYTPLNGLPVLGVLEVFQDSYGFIWINSFDGLVRFDGTEYRRFVSDPDDEATILHTYNFLTFADLSGSVWAGGRGNTISRYITEKDEFYTYHLESHIRFRHGAVDGDDNIWLTSSNKLYTFDRQAEEFVVKHEFESGINQLRAHENGDLLLSIGTNADNYQIVWYTNNEFLFIATPEGIKESIEGGKVSSSSWGVNITLSPINEDYFMILYGSNFNLYDLSSQEWIKSGELPNAKPTLRPTKAAWDHRDYIWYVDLYGLTRFNPFTGNYQLFANNPQDKKSIVPIGGTGGAYVFMDRQSNLWMPNLVDGISVINTYNNDFGELRDEFDKEYLNAINLIEDSDNNLWISTDSPERILIYTDSSGRLLREISETDIFGSNTPYPIYMDWGGILEAADGGIWASFTAQSTNDGLILRIDPNSYDITTINIREIITGERVLPRTFGLPGNAGYSIWELSNGNILASDVQAGTNYIIDYKTLEVNKFQILIGDSIVTEPIYVSAVFNNGDLLIRRLIAEEVKYSLYKLSHTDYSYEYWGPYGGEHSNIIPTYEDRSGNLWTFLREGFGTVKPVSREIIDWFGYDDLGIPSAFVLSSDFDLNGNIWITSRLGVYKFNLETGSLVHYSIDTGIRENSTQWIRVSDRGLIYTGGIGGINRLSSDKMTINPYPPELVFTNIRFDGEEISHKTNDALERYIVSENKVTIPHNVSLLQIDFSALHFSGFQSNNYRYKLVGFDSEWRDGGKIGSAIYTNLNSGEYQFQVKASNLDGIWTPEPKSLQLVVLSPWYKTNYAYFFYAVLLFLVILGLFRLQKTRLLRIEEEKRRQSELDKANEIRLAYSKLEAAHRELKDTQEQLIQQEKLASLGQLTAGIAHEIKNPLNFVNNFSDVSIEMIDEAIDEVKAQDLAPPAEEEILEILSDIKSNLAKIHEHGSRADGIVKSMLQHSRGGTGKMEPTDLNTLIKEYVNLSFHGMRAGKNPINVDIQLDLDDSIGKLDLIGEDFSRVILNLCNNAFDAMRSNSKERLATLNVRTIKHEDYITIEIQDNGPGIPDDIKDKIMQPFFTTKQGTEGTGLGLSITHDIVKAHGGEMSVESKVGEGTIFKIILHNQ